MQVEYTNLLGMVEIRHIIMIARNICVPEYQITRWNPGDQQSERKANTRRKFAGCGATSYLLCVSILYLLPASAVSELTVILEIRWI